MVAESNPVEYRAIIDGAIRDALTALGDYQPNTI